MATPETVTPTTNEKVVTVPRESAPPPAAAPDDFDTKYKARLEQDDEIKSLREKARRAEELEAEREALRQQAPPVQRYQPPAYRQPPPPGAAGFDINRWRELARIDPGAAYLEMERIQQARRQAELDAVRTETAQTILHANRYQQQAQQGHEWLRSELPEVFDGRSTLQKRAVEIYNSDPWYQSQGDGHVIAAKLAAAEVGIVPKSKRARAEAVSVERESDDQNVERGTRRPPRDREGAGDAADGPLSAREKKMIEDMGLDEKKFRIAKRARAERKDVRVS